MDYNKPIELFKGIYWIGSKDQKGKLHCNSYLLIEGDEAILIDPGSIFDFEDVYEKVTQITSIDKIKYVILHHQDPDLCSSVPLFEQKGGKFQIITHWRTKTLVVFYGIKSDFYIINSNKFELTLQSGRILKFIPTPYLHFPGAITTYDTNSKILFSSDLFGALSNKWTPFADDSYIESMKLFHEHFMPSNDILRPVMEVFLQMEIDMIAPQHGSIINHEVKKYIRILRDLECGILLKPIRKELSKSGGYLRLCSLVIQRFASLFSKQEIVDVVKKLKITLDEENLNLLDFDYTGETLWNTIFEQILAQKGIEWILLIEPYITKMSKEYQIDMPLVFEASTQKAYYLEEENKKLKATNERLEIGLKETQERLIRCPVTGLYNYDFFKDYLTNLLKQDSVDENFALIIIKIDNTAKIRFSYGENEVDNILKNTVYTINEIKEEATILFRLQGATFAWYLPNTTRKSAILSAEKVRNAVAESNRSIEKITVSLGVIWEDELRSNKNFTAHPFEVLYELAMLRVNIAQNQGKNIVCSNSETGVYKESMGKILIVDTDDVNVDVIKTFLENMKYEVFTASDGDTALSIAENELPALVITEIMLPKMDGFLVRERLLKQSQTKNITFIFASHLKNETSMQRALSLGIEHYLKKPFMLSELLGIIKLKIKGDIFQ